MIRRTFPRAGNPPHVPALVNAIRAEMAKANAGSFHVFVRAGFVDIEQGGWTGVNLATIQAAVDAAPDATAALLDKDRIGAMDPWLKAAFLVVLDEVNRLRQNPTSTYPTVTPAQFITAVKAKRDTL